MSTNRVIIPGAVYVSPNLGIPLIALTDRLLMHRGGREGNEMMFGLSGREVPEDLILVYAPGDKVEHLKSAFEPKSMTIVSHPGLVDA